MRHTLKIAVVLLQGGPNHTLYLTVAASRLLEVRRLTSHRGRWAGAL